MSLINDALKKAKQAQEQNEPPRTAPEFRSAEADPARGNNSSLLMVGLLVVAVLVGGVLIWLGLGGRQTVASAQTQQPATAPVSPATALAAQPVQKPAVVKPVAETPTTATAIPRKETSEPLSRPADTLSPSDGERAGVRGATENTNATLSPAPPAEPPKPVIPKLGGIFFNPTRPAAVLNNKTVYVGSRSGDFTVLAITAQSVTVAGNGQTNVLSLSE
ncbi:MAG: hypothetical protein EPO07_12485 [Verrucomicrobia bacterium]|nr:MAG: hypothetical protein EPO07_12485 [Verrucomicrobiota bacterium]